MVTETPYNLGASIIFLLDEEEIEGRIIAIHETKHVIESNPAWEEIETKYRYMVDVESKDMGWTWTNHKNIIHKIEQTT